MGISAKQLREFYVGCIRLYGVIDSNNAFNILKIYYPDAKKETFLKDLKDRMYKFTKDYSVWSTRKKNTFLIGDFTYDDEMLDYIIPEQQDKPFYIPETYDKFLRHSQYEYWKQVNIKNVKALAEILNKNNEIETDITISIIFEDFKSISSIKDSDPLTYTIRRLLMWGYELKREQLDSLASILQDLYNNTKLSINRGYSPNELRKLYKPADINKVKMTLGPNIRKMLEDGEIDIDEYINQVIDSNIPRTAKESLLEELGQIKRQKINNKA